MDASTETTKRLPCWLVGHRTTAQENGAPVEGVRYFVEVCEVCEKSRRFYVDNRGRHNTTGFYRG